jgi:hypothetical protein
LVLSLFVGSKGLAWQFYLIIFLEKEIKPTDCPTELIAKHEKKSKKPVKLVVKPAVPGTLYVPSII